MVSVETINVQPNDKIQNNPSLDYDCRNSMNGLNYDSNLSYVPLYSFSQWAPIFQYLFWFLHTQLCAESKKKRKEITV